MNTKVVSEGAARISLPDGGQVFYNPVQVFNRDLSVMAINRFCAVDVGRSKWSVLEALSATGLRAVRYALECPKLTRIVANDIDPDAVKLIKRSIHENACQDKVSTSCGDANLVMLQLSKQDDGLFDIIDLDPYGSAAPFLDSAMQAIADKGLLCITCTDMAALCASYSDACLAKYGSVPVKGDICHEFAVRIVLNCVERAAARHRRSIEPLMSCAIDFYSRVFVRVHHARGEYLFKAPLMAGYLLKCPDCRFHQVQPMCRSLGKNEKSFKIGPAPLMANSACPYCQGHAQIAGPFWTGPLHCRQFVDGLCNPPSVPASITTAGRIQGLAAVCAEETAPTLPPLYYSISELAHTLRSPTPSMDKIMFAIKNGGFDLAVPHSSPTSIKTNAPFVFLLAIFRRFLLESNTEYSFEDKQADSIKSKIWRSFSKQGVSFDICFDKNSMAIPDSKKSQAVRFPPNPEKNWGPKPKAGRVLKDEADEKDNK